MPRLLSRRSVLVLLAAPLTACGWLNSPSQQTPAADIGPGRGGPGPPGRLGPDPTPTRVRRLPADAVGIGVLVEPAGVAALPSPRPSTDPAEAVSRLVANLVFSQLVGADDRTEPFPDLAESVPTIENGGARLVGDADAQQLQVTFKLRKAHWSDGAPVVSRDVLFSWGLARNPFIAPTETTESRIERIDLPDDGMVVVSFHSERSARAAAARDPNRLGFLADQRGPVLDPLYPFGLPGTWIFPSHVLGPALGGDPRRSPRVADLLRTGAFARAPIGSGPYVLREWRPGERLTLTARPDYHRGAPKVGTIVIRIPPPGAQGAQPLPETPPLTALLDWLRAGEIDVIGADALQGPSLDVLAGEPGLRLLDAPSTSWERLDLNQDTPALGDPRVRQALLHAIDRRDLAGLALGAAAGQRAVDQDPRLSRYPYDPGRAESLLDAAGWVRGTGGVRTRDRQPLSLRLVTTDSPRRRHLAERIAAHLAKVGVDAVPQAVPADDLFDRPDGLLARRHFDLALYGSVGGIDPVRDLAEGFASVAVPSRANSFTGDNAAGFRDPELDRLIDEAARALERTKQQQLVAQVRERLLAALPTLPLFTYPRIVASSDALRGIKPSVAPIGETWNAAEWGIS